MDGELDLSGFEITKVLVVEVVASTWHANITTNPLASLVALEEEKVFDT